MKTQNMKENYRVVTASLLLVTLPLTTSFTLSDITAEWDLYQTRFSKTYISLQEEQLRFGIFAETLHRISLHNEAALHGKYSYTVDVNHFADMTDEEYEQRMFNPFLVTRKYSIRSSMSPKEIMANLTYIPKAVDWRHKNCITAVKDQGSCHSCYAFAATGALESHFCLKTGNLVSLSEQNIIDCTNNIEFQNRGCEGGMIENSFIYIVDNGGIDTELAYPYKHTVGTCQFNKTTIGASAKDMKDVLPRGDEHALQKVVGGLGPVAVSVDASGFGFKQYSGGIFYNVECSQKNLTHGMLVVGYGTENFKEYWVIKNSWNTGWGMAGYMKMVRNKDNHCGIASLASYPIV